MAYRVVIQPQAEGDIREAYLYIFGQGAPEAAARWYRQIRTEISSLQSFPERGAVAPEAEKLQHPLRQIHFGKRSGIYRIIYRVLQDMEEVHVLTIRHGARTELLLGDLAD